MLAVHSHGDCYHNNVHRTVILRNIQCTSTSLQTILRFMDLSGKHSSRWRGSDQLSTREHLVIFVEEEIDISNHVRCNEHHMLTPSRPLLRHVCQEHLTVLGLEMLD